MVAAPRARRGVLAMDGCFAGKNASCDIETVACDGVETAASKPVAPPLRAATQSELPSSAAPPAPLPAPVPVSAPEPVSPASLFTQYYSAITADIATFVRQFDLQKITLIAATAAVCLFVGTQLYSLIRTGRRRLRDIAFNALVSLLFVLAMTIMWFAVTYTSLKANHVWKHLSPAGQILLSSSVIGDHFLLVLPVSILASARQDHLLSTPRANGDY